MTYLSIIEKFKILIDMLLDFKLVLIFSILLMIFAFLYIIKKITGKKYILMMVLSLILMLLISIMSNYKILANTFDNFTTIFFGSIYFPSIYVYVAVLVINLVAFITSILNINLGKSYKIINTISFVLNNILFVIILNIVAKNKIDIFSVSSLYTNTNLVAILEISMNLFVLWFLSLIVIFATNAICIRFGRKKVKTINSESMYSEELIKSDDNISLATDEVISPVLEEQGSLALENDINENIVPNVIFDEAPNTLIVDNNNDHTTFEDILNGTLPVTYYENDKVVNESYNIIDPQKIYEEKYITDMKGIKEKATFQDIVQNIEVPSLNNLSNNEKRDLVKDKLIENTISLKELTDEDIDIKKASVTVEKLNKYTINDYKKIVNMLNNLKNHTSTNNVSIDDAITISLINNYSLEDCIKFKEILKSSLN